MVKQKISQLLSRPMTTYLLSALACLLLIIACAMLLFMNTTGIRDTLVFLLIVATLLVSWTGWAAYVLGSRRAIHSLRNKMIQVERTGHRTAESIKKQLSKSQMRHLEEYRKQSYNLLVSLQDLRLAALQEKEK